MGKLSVLLIFTVMLVASGCSGKSKRQNIEVITLNVRLDTPVDSANAWPNRASYVFDYINGVKPDLLGMQEVLLHQYQELDSALTDYTSVGVGRSDGGKGGEMNPVFFKKERFDMVRTKTFWLSETPDSAGSKAWGAGLPRIVTWVELVDKRNHERLYFFNTHFAHDSDTARINSAKLLLMAVDSITGVTPFIVTGDFNMDENSEGYSILTGPYESVPLFVDTYTISQRAPQGLTYTFNGFRYEPGDARIDYVFVRNGMKVMEHETPELTDFDIFISDHWPVRTIVSIN